MVAVLVAGICLHAPEAAALSLSARPVGVPLLWFDIDHDEGDAGLNFSYGGSAAADGGWSTGMAAVAYGSVSGNSWLMWTWYDDAGTRLRCNVSAALTLEGNPGEEADVTVTWRNHVVYAMMNVAGSVGLFPTPVVSAAAAELKIATAIGGQAGYAESHVEKVVDTYFLISAQSGEKLATNSFSAGRLAVGEEMLINEQYLFDVLATCAIGGNASVVAWWLPTVTYSIAGVTDPEPPEDLPIPPVPDEPPPFPPTPVPEPITLFGVLGALAFIGLRCRCVGRGSHA